MIKMGRAYGIFKCNAGKEEIENEFPTVRELVQTPREMELYLSEGMDNLEDDDNLIKIAKEARKSGMKYILKADYPSATNMKTADELAAILNQLYNTSLYNEGEKFLGGIVYKKGHAYIFRE